MESLAAIALGCGRLTQLADYGLKDDAGVLIPADALAWYTLDADPTVGATFTATLGRDPIPLPDNSLDLAIAMHVLEHIGRQGETAEWFFFWEDLYRVLKPGGAIQFECPLSSSLWAWADPTHVRAINEYTFLYLRQASYTARPSAIPGYRVRCDFVPVGFERVADILNPGVMELEAVSHLRGRLRAIKPLVPWWEPAP